MLLGNTNVVQFAVQNFYSHECVILKAFAPG